MTLRPDLRPWLIPFLFFVLLPYMYMYISLIYNHCHLPKLSTSKINNAKLCLTNNPTPPTTTCINNNSFVNLSSLFGPNHTSHRLINVKFELSIIFPSSSLLISNNLSLSNVVKKSNCKEEGDTVSHFVVEISRSPVRALKCGSRCLGQGINLKS
jgi:hypothetical protein